MNNLKTMSRANYKEIKRMDKEALTEYLYRIYQRGYRDGCEAAKKEPTAEPAAAEATEKR